MAATAPAFASRLLSAQQLRGMDPKARAGRVLLYDGVCILCNKSLQFIAKRDPDRNIMFCSIQSKAAEPYLQAVGLTRKEALQQLLFIEYKDVSEGSTAALKVAGYMRQPWPLLTALLVVPQPVRDSLYSLVAANRYRLFGRTTHCQVPPTAFLDRFVDRDELLSGTCTTESMDEKDEGRPGGGGTP